MTLRFYYHPLASFCHKVLIALREKNIAFEPVIVDFGNPESVAGFKAVWPMAKMPVLVDESRGETVAETTIILEYLEQYFGGPKLLPGEPREALQARFWDRFFDQYVEVPMQKIVTDNLRPEGQGDAFGVDQARGQLLDAYAVIEKQIAGKEWALGNAFSIADCSAAPALFYAGTVEPIFAFPLTRAYRERLIRRQSYTQVLREAQPYFVNFPMPVKPDISLIH